MSANDPARLLAALHQTAHARMIADVPSVKTRMEFMQAWREAGDWLRDNNAAQRAFADADGCQKIQEES